MSKVIVGMSGGVDSAVTAYLLKEAGYEVIGVTLRTWLSDDGEEGRCCEIDDARRVAWKLDIPYHTFNCTSVFDEKVIKPFVDSYICGLTPNPCIECNRYVKWERMMYAAKVLGADYIATGHYAYIERCDNGRYAVKKALHDKKDQTYMLYKLTQEQLSHTLMPLGKYSKDEVREIATKIGLSVASKPDSQEICFVPDDDYAGFIEHNSSKPIPKEGNFVDEDGKVLGKHKGIIHYTVGQRKGLGLAMGTPVFVKEIRADRDEVVIGSEAALYSDTVICDDVNFQSIDKPEIGERVRCRAKIRYHHKAADAYIEMIDEDRLKITFDSPVKSATPGQSAVFYDENDCVVGGGIIRK